MTSVKTRIFYRCEECGQEAKIVCLFSRHHYCDRTCFEAGLQSGWDLDVQPNLKLA